MRAVFVREPGGPEQLEFRELPDPTPGPHELRLANTATALNRADLLQRRGLYPPPPGAPASLGLECAGVVEAVGPGVTRFRVGDRVMALLAGGGYANQVIVHEGSALPVPAGLDLRQAAAVPEAFLTASEALFSSAALAADETVLVHAAAGGVGSAVVQLALAAGARVLATAGTDAKVHAVQGLGAPERLRVINYRSEDFADVARQADLRPDVIIDFIGGAYWERHAAILRPGGRVVVLGLLGGRNAKVDLSRLLSQRQSLLGMVMRTRSVAEKAALTARFEARFAHALGKGLRPLVDQVVPWTDVARAHERMEANLNVGKIVLEIC